MNSIPAKEIKIFILSCGSIGNSKVVPILLMEFFANFYHKHFKTLFTHNDKIWVCEFLARFGRFGTELPNFLK